MSRTHWFRHCAVLEYPDADENGLLITIFHDGRFCDATRDNEMRNLDYARSLGYDTVRDALREHELAHCWIEEKLADQASGTLRAVAGGEGYAYHDQLGEEALVLNFQKLLNGLEINTVYWGHLLPQLVEWRDEFLARFR